jgi:hypothetical protein
MKINSIPLPLIFLFFIILFTLIFRVRLLNIPLERDEGEYAYMGQLILDGTPPYTEAYNMKFPGIYFIYAGILWLFGETHMAIHFCLLIVNLLSIVLLYIFARVAYDDWIAAASASAFALLSMSYHVLGFWANAEHFILPFVIGANILLLFGLRKSKISYFLFSGVLFGCAALIKQHGAFFGFFGFIVLLVSLWQKKTIDKKTYWKYALAYLGGVFIPLFLCFLYLAHAGVLEKFYLWTFTYAKEYSTILSIGAIKLSFIGGFQNLFYFASLIWVVAGIGLITIFSNKFNKQSGILTLGLFIAGIIAVSVGFYFRPHYFILVLPAVALFFGIGIRYIFHVFSSASSSIVRYLPPIFVITIAILGTIAAHWDVLYEFSAPKVTQTVYNQHPFSFSEIIAKIIKEKTSKEDRIAIMGNEPQFLFYSQRRSATSFIYTYSIAEDQPFAEQFRLEMMHQVESVTPKLLIYTNIQPEWYKKPKCMEELDEWFMNYSKLYYTMVARFEYNNIADTLLITDTKNLSMKPTHLFWITIYETKKSSI